MLSLEISDIKFKMMITKIGLILILAVISQASAASLPLAPLKPSEEYTHSTVIDEENPSQYAVYWKLINKEEIQFEVHCRTTGWVGFGLSPNGGMNGADIAIAWVDGSTGSAQLKDTHATGFSTPQTDPQQDWFLIEAAELSGYTIVKMKRKLNTCDKDHDMEIKAETNYLIVAWDDADPITGNNDWRYHGANRRSKVEFLLLYRDESLTDEDHEIANSITVEYKLPNVILNFFFYFLNLDCYILHINFFILHERY